MNTTGERRSLGSPPDEIWLAIMSHLYPSDIIALTQVNHALLRIGRDIMLWRDIIEREWTKYSESIRDTGRPKPPPNREASRLPQISHEQALWGKIYSKFDHMFGSVYMSPDPEGREGPNYALTVLPCDMGIQFWRCEPRDCFVHYHRWCPTYTPLMKVTLDSKFRVKNTLIDTIWNAKVAQIGVDRVARTVTLRYAYTVQGMPPITDESVLQCQEIIGCVNQQVRYVPVNIPAVSTFRKLGQGIVNCKYISPGVFIGANGSRRGAGPADDRWSSLVSDLIYLDQDLESHLRAFKVTSLDHLSAGELFFDCDITNAVKADHAQQTDGRAFLEKIRLCSNKKYKGPPDFNRSHECHLYKRHHGWPGVKMCAVRWIGQVARHDRTQRAPIYYRGTVAVHDENSLVVSWCPRGPNSGVQSMLYLRIKPPSTGTLDMDAWWNEEQEAASLYPTNAMA